MAHGSHLLLSGAWASPGMSESSCLFYANAGETWVHNSTLGFRV
jgi:hypothetical protein